LLGQFHDELINEQLIEQEDEFEKLIADGLEELFCVMKENKIDVDRIDFMKHIATVIDSGLNISHFHLSGSSETYENWIKKCVEICEDETVTVDFILVDGSKFSQDATYNLATNVLTWEDMPETDSKDISSVSFQREHDEEGSRINVCKECLEGCYVEGSLKCPECDGMIVWRNFVETPLTD